MKTCFLVGALGLLLAFASGCASHRVRGNERALAKQDAATDCSAGALQPKIVNITGSYIKQPVSRNGLITDTPSQVLVVDSHAIQTSGVSDLKQLLQRYGLRQ